MDIASITKRLRRTLKHLARQLETYTERVDHDTVLDHCEAVLQSPRGGFYSFVDIIYEHNEHNKLHMYRFHLYIHATQLYAVVG